MTGSLAACTARAFALPLLTTALALAQTTQPAATIQAVGALLAQLPARIIPNEGQWNSPELYRMRVGGMRVFLEQSGWSFWLRESAPSRATDGAVSGPRGQFDEKRLTGRAVALRMTFVGAGQPTLTPERPLHGVTNYLIGREAAAHRVGVAGYGAVLYESMYPGVDVRVREADGRMEYDLLLAPGADLAQVRVQVAGTSSVLIDATGALVLQTELGEMRQPEPTTWELTATGERRAVRCSYVLHDDGAFGLVAPERDPALALVVDPPLVWSNYIGGSAYDEPVDVREDGTGKVLLCGYTESFDYPTTPGAVQSTYVGPGTLGDGFIMHLDPSQPPASQIIFSTFFGGSAFDWVTSVVAANGLIAFAGGTNSTDLPVGLGVPYQAANAGSRDSFVGVMDPTGTTLLAMTYFGGSGPEYFPSLHAGANGDLYLVGQTRSPNLPTTANAHSQTHNGGLNPSDGYVAQFDALATTLNYCTYFGGSGDEWLWAGDLSASGVLTMVSGTSSLDYPMGNGTGYDTTHNGGTAWWRSDTAIVQLDPSLPPGQQVVYATYLGHTGDDWPFSVTVSANGEIVVSGTTNSGLFPTTAGAYQSTFQGGITTGNFFAGDGYVTKIDPTVAGAAGLVASTYFGGNYWDQGLECTVDSQGEVTLVGWANLNSNLPTTPGAMRRTHALNDGFIARFSSDFKQLLYGSYIGGSGHDGAWLVAHHADGIATVFAQTQSTDVPMVGGFQMTNPGGNGPFVARYSLIPAGTTRYGAPTVGSNGHPTIHALDDATLGNQQFGVACSRAPASTLGAIMFAWASAPGVPLFGIDLYVDINAVAATSFLLSDVNGEQQWSLPLPAVAIGSLYAQYVWLENGTPLTLSASDALQIN